MVSALKLDNKEKNSLGLLMQRFNKEQRFAYNIEPEVEEQVFDSSIQKLAVNSIIEGYFPKENLVKDMAIKRVNKSLCIILSTLIFVVVVSYYFVISCEMKLNDLSRQTVILNNENEELENKLDSMKSFNNVDKTMEKNNMLKRAGQVIETTEIQLDPTPQENKIAKRTIFKSAIGF